MDLEHIKLLIKNLFAQGMTRSKIVSELVHQGYNPNDVEDALNRLFYSGELPGLFSNGNGNSSIVSESSGGKINLMNKKNKIFIFSGILILIAIAVFFGVKLYYEKPNIITDEIFKIFSSANSFEFDVVVKLEGEEKVSVHGIAILRNSPNILIDVSTPFISGGNVSILRVNNNEIVFKTDDGNELSKYDWISSSFDMFNDNSKMFELNNISDYIYLLENVSEEKGKNIIGLTENILHGPVLKYEKIGFNENYINIKLDIDSEYKKTLIKNIIGDKNNDFVNTISKWDWVISYSNDPENYSLYIVPAEQKNKLNSSVVINFSKFNYYKDIPFDSVTTPFTNVITWIKASSTISQ